MCISPLKIPNPNYGLSKVGLNRLKDTVHSYLSVPCGYCSECIHRRQSDYIQRLVMEEQYRHLFFCTITYQNSAIPVITDSNGYEHRFADVRDVQNMIKRIRKNNLFGRDFRYFAVSELGSKRGRPHFHIIFAVNKQPDDDFLTIVSLEHQYFNAVLNEWRRNIGSTRKPEYVPLCKYVRYYTRNGVRSTYDFHYISPRNGSRDCSNVGFYVLKYMLKPSDKAVRLQRALRLNLPEDEYKSIWSIIKPRTFKSLHFGDDVFIKGVPVTFDIEMYISNCIRKSPRDKYPMFFNPSTGQSFVLSDYYKKRFLTVSEALKFPLPDERPEPEHDHISQLLTKECKHEKIKSIEESRDIFDDFPFE